MSMIKDFIDYIGVYPMWVKVAIIVLLACIALLLVLFRPKPENKRSETSAAVVPLPPSVGRTVFLDVSYKQDKWNGLTAWAHRMGISLHSKTFEVANFSKESQPGVLVYALPHHELINDTTARLIKKWVENGGGLFILGYYASDTHHGSNLSRLTREWGFSFNDDLLMPNGKNESDTRAHVFRADPNLGANIEIQPGDGRPHAILKDIKKVIALSSASLDLTHKTYPPDFVLETAPDTDVWKPEGPLDPQNMRLIIEKWTKSRQASAPFLVLFQAGLGRVAICGTWKIASLDYGDNWKLVTNIIDWLRPKTDSGPGA